METPSWTFQITGEGAPIIWHQNDKMIKYPELHKNPLTSDRWCGECSSRVLLHRKCHFLMFLFTFLTVRGIVVNLRSFPNIKDSWLPLWMQFCKCWLCHDCNGMSFYSDHPCNKATQCQLIMVFTCSDPGESRRGDTAPTIPTSPAGWRELLVMEVIMQNLGMPGKLIQCKIQNICWHVFTARLLNILQEDHC